MILVTRHLSEKSENIILGQVRKIVTEINVRNLDKKETSDLIKAVLKENPSKSLLDFIYKTTNGNPFFVSTYCDYLLKNNWIDKRGSFASLRSNSASLPDNIKDVIVAKADGLKRDSK